MFPHTGEGACSSPVCRVCQQVRAGRREDGPCAGSVPLSLRLRCGVSGAVTLHIVRWLARSRAMAGQVPPAVGRRIRTSPAAQRPRGAPCRRGHRFQCPAAVVALLPMCSDVWGCGSFVFRCVLLLGHSSFMAGTPPVVVGCRW